MKKIYILPLLMALAACTKPVDRPAVAKKGQPAPQISVEKVIRGDLKPFKGWEDLKGKAVVLEFWATWCGPCRQNIPHMNELAGKFEGKPVVFLSLTKEKQETVEEFLKTQEMKGNLGVEAAAAFKSFSVRGIPHTVLIDKNSVVKAFTYPSDVTEQTIEDLLAGKETAVKDMSEPEEEAGGETAGAAAPADATASFSIAPSKGKPSMRYGDNDFNVDGITLSYAMEMAMRSAHGVEFKDVPRELLDGKYKVSAKVDMKAAGNNGDGALRDLLLAGFNGAFPFKASLVKKRKNVLLLKRAGAGKLVKFEGKGGSRSSSNDGKSASMDSQGGFMYELADQLEDWLNTPVLDETGLGFEQYNFALKAEPVDLKGVGAALAPLGLKLVEARRDVEIVEVVGRKDALLAAKH